MNNFQIVLFQSINILRVKNIGNIFFIFSATKVPSTEISLSHLLALSIYHNTKKKARFETIYYMSALVHTPSFVPLSQQGNTTF